MSLARARVIHPHPRPSLPNPHDRRWQGLGRLPADLLFSRDEYDAWAERGMIPRGVVLLWVGGKASMTPVGERCGYVFVLPPPRRVKPVEDAPSGEPGTVAGEGAQGGAREGAGQGEQARPASSDIEEPAHPGDAGEE